MLGQLQDAGNTTTLAHYLKLLESAFPAGGLELFSRGKDVWALEVRSGRSGKGSGLSGFRARYPHQVGLRGRPGQGTLRHHHRPGIPDQHPPYNWIKIGRKNLKFQLPVGFSEFMATPTNFLKMEYDDFYNSAQFLPSGKAGKAPSPSFSRARGMLIQLRPGRLGSETFATFPTVRSQRQRPGLRPGLLGRRGPGRPHGRDPGPANKAPLFGHHPG
jgi:hypothetical protein